ncbi:PEP/pyruvate-binding domain-containing protein [Thermodesulfobacteriota bacterium]
MRFGLQWINLAIVVIGAPKSGTVNIRDLIRQLTEKEPLNPYQIAGMASVMKHSAITPDDGATLHVEGLKNVLMVLDRAGEEASPYLIGLRQADTTLTLFPKFPQDRLEALVHLSPFEGRRLAIRETLIPMLFGIPNWLDLVRTLSRYAMERDDNSLAGNHAPVMEIVLAYFFAATRQPFDAEASSEAEYALSRLIESILKSATDGFVEAYVPFMDRSLDFLVKEVLPAPTSPFERRILEYVSILSALKNCSGAVRDRLNPHMDKMAAQALITALGQVKPVPDDLLSKVADVVSEVEFPGKEGFLRDVLGRLRHHSAGEIDMRREALQAILDGTDASNQGQIRGGISFIKGFAEEWRATISAFEAMAENLPEQVQSAFAEVLTAQILNIDKPEVKDLLVDGLCRIVVRLEKTRKQASRLLVQTFTRLLMDSAHATEQVSEIVSSFKAVESLGVTLGRHGYVLMARVMTEQLVGRPLTRPTQKKYTIEDDDTGEPLVLAEESGGNRAHIRHIKSILAIIASNPRIMHRLIPYLIVEMEIGGTVVRDEDLIQYPISRLIRANSAITHFPVRTLIKAVPYSFKDIGPLENLRLTAAGLAKELANRGVKPIGNFLGKLRGDIHWRGSIENFYFCQAILRYFSSRNPEEISDWMPAESMPYLSMDQWCSTDEADGIRDICRSLFRDHDISPDETDGLMPVLEVDTTRYSLNEQWPEFSRRVVLQMIDMMKGLHAKYFVETHISLGASAEDELASFERIIHERGMIQSEHLIPDIRAPMPAPVTLTEGSGDYVREMDRLSRDEPETPIILRAKKAGHAYAQRATYIEPRFAAFNRDLAMESLQETLASTISNTHFDEITLENLPSSLQFLDCLVRGIAVNGHSSYYLEQAGSDLRKAGPLGLTFDKVRDLLKNIKKELDDISLHYRNLFEEPFDNCLSACTMESLPRKLKDLTTLKEIPDSDFFRNYLKTLYISDLQARDGNLRVLETFVEKVEQFLNQRLAESGRRVVQTGDEPVARVPFYFPDQGEISPCSIGLKASLLRFAENTPPYFVITTDQILREPEAMMVDEEFRSRLSDAVALLEHVSGRSFGDVDNPALVSVRSGARISMPGMMITITNVGINDEIAAVLAEKVNPWFAYDSYRRFIQEFGQSVFGVGREEFQDIIDERKVRWRVNRKAEMSADQMKQLAFDYKTRVRELVPEAIDLIDGGRFLDVLIRCAMVVLHSSDGAAARQYREAAGIDGNWRTALVVQSMVYGNLEFRSSGTGVVSYNPFTLDLRGDFSRGDQGTDVVDGKVITMPVYDLWKRDESLASLMPDCWRQLSSIVHRIAERLHFDVNIEYTIEKGRVYVLQIRKNREKRERLPSLKEFGYEVVAQGTGISGKIFRGIMVTDRNQIAPFRHITKAQSIIDSMNEELREGEKLDGFIFVVNDPIPEEIMEEVFSLPVPTALVSRLGGRGAHAADIAKSLKKVYVAQVRQIAKYSGRPEWIHIGGQQVIVGSKMILHGQTGELALYDRSSEAPGG